MVGDDVTASNSVIGGSMVARGSHELSLQEYMSMIEGERFTGAKFESKRMQRLRTRQVIKLY